MAVIEFKSFEDRTKVLTIRVNPGWKKLLFSQANKRGMSASEMVIWSVNAFIHEHQEWADELGRRHQAEDMRKRLPELGKDLQVELQE